MKSFATLPLLLAAGCLRDWRRGDGAAAGAELPEMRKLNIGVSVAPPNVVHTTPYVAKELGLFEKRCIDANIIAVRGRRLGRATSGRAGLVDRQRHRHHGRPRHEGAADLGLRAAPAADLHRAGRIKTPADLKGKRLSAAGGGVGGFNWRMGRDMLASRPRRGRRGVRLAGPRRPPARPAHRPARRRLAASRGRLSSPRSRSRG